MAGLAGGFNPFSAGNLKTGPGRVGFKMELKGLGDLVKTLDRRILRMQQSMLRKACQAFAEPIRADAQRRANALVSSGAVDIHRPGFSDIEIATEIRMRGTTATVKIGPRGAFFWLFFFEYGYWIRKEPKGPPLTWVQKRPTMRPAYDAHKEEGLAAMEKILWDAFSQEVAA